MKPPFDDRTSNLFLLFFLVVAATILTFRHIEIKSEQSNPKKQCEWYGFVEGFNISSYDKCLEHYPKSIPCIKKCTPKFNRTPFTTKDESHDGFIDPACFDACIKRGKK